MNTLKETIKVLAEQQISLKNQRKTVHLIGERTLDPWRATLNHEINRHNLRLLYTTQQLLKGKSLKEIEPHNHESTIPLSAYQKELDQLVEKYGEVAHSN